MATTEKKAIVEEYRYTAEMQYVLNNEGKKLDERNIKMIMIDRDFDNTNMPMIFVQVAIDRAMLDDMISKNGKGVIHLTIYKYVYKEGDTPGVKTVYIQDQFVYFIGEKPNLRKGMDEFDKDMKEQEQLYTNVYIGLMKLDLINKNKQVFNGVFNNTTMVNLVQYATKQFPMLIEPLKYNKTMNNFIVPHVNSVTKFLSYLNKLSVFYDTQYRFFMDFDTTYLVSSSGKPIIKKGETNKCNSVAVWIRDPHSSEAKILGMIIDRERKTYQIDVSAVDTKMDYNTATEKLVNSLKVVSTTSSLGNVGVNVNNSDYMQEKETIINVKNENQGMVSNIKSSLMSNANIFEFNKTDIDPSVFTINKEYLVKSFGIYDERSDGRYLLSRTREIFVREDMSYRCNICVTLRQINS